jgi:two-component system, LytTR family, response regulator AlgR
MSYRLLIVDDEAPARERLRALLAEVGATTEVFEAANGEEALRQAREHEPDIVLLDVRMPGMDGLEVGRALAEMPEPPAVVFTTAFDEYAVRAFDAQAVAYLLKPIRREKLAAALAQASRLTRPQIQQAAASARYVERRTHLPVRQRDSLKLLPVDDIAYLVADQKYVTVRHTGGEDLTDLSLKTLEDEFAGTFVRIHRSALVNVSHLTAIDRDADGQCFVRLRGREERLAVSRRMAGELRERFRI